MRMCSEQRAQRTLVEWDEGLAQPQLAGPLRILQQRAADTDQVELAAIEPFHQQWNVVRSFGAAVAVGIEHSFVQPDAADGHGELARHLLRPAGEIERRALELR